MTSIVASYGPRTTALIVFDDGVYEFSHDANGASTGWLCSSQRIVIAKETTIFSPGNLRATAEHDGYRALVQHYVEHKYQLRYTGGLVPDAYQLFTKRQGVFTFPTSSSRPPKLRMVFEAAPVALLVEAAGGATSDGVSGGSLLDVKITHMDQRTPLCLGSMREVSKASSAAFD